MQQSTPRERERASEEAAAPRQVPIRSRAFTERQEYDVQKPKTVEIRRLVSPSHRLQAENTAISKRQSPKAMPKENWQEEAARLSRRVQQLEHENAQLKQQTTPFKKPKATLSKSQSCVNGFGYTGLTVAEAAAASHRSRSSRRLAHKSLEKYRAGYWNGENNVKSSFSCNNLADMERRALRFEFTKDTDAVRPPMRKSSSATGRQIRKSDSFHRSSSAELTTGNEFAQQQQQLAIAKSFRPSNGAQPSSPQKSTQSKATKARDKEVDDDVRVTSPRSYVEAGIRRAESFRLQKSASASASAPTRPKASDVRMWVGTWNMGAADPFVDGGGIIDEQRSASMLQSFVPHGYHVYVLGVQEGVSENVYHAIEAYLNRNDDGMRYFRMELKNSESLIKHKNYPADAVMDAVRGRGDGAFVGTKFTGLAVFYAAKVSEKVKLLRAGVHKFNLTSGSKGGVAAALLVNQTTIVFVNCHLDARNDSYRREQIRNLNANLGRIMGHGSFDLTEQFHHVVWMGDMNYRIVLLDPPLVLHMLEEGRTMELHDKFDGLLNDRRNGGVFEGFTEPSKFPDFYPTYKKFPKRGLVNDRLPSWPALVYRVLYKEPFYKGGKVKKRVPGWCDRILTHSLLVGDSKLLPEKVQSPVDPTQYIDNYRSINHGDGMDVSDHSPVCGTFVLSFPTTSTTQSHDLVRRNSRSYSAVHDDLVNDQYRRSVGGSYFDQARVVRRINHVLNRPVSTVLRVFNMQLYWNENVVVPKRCRVVAPLVGEDPTGGLKQCDVIGERCQGLNGLNLSLNAVVQHSRPLQQLHMLVWIKNESISGHCTLSLKRIAKTEEGGEVRFRVPLYHNSMRLYHEGHPLLVVFSVRSKTFAK